MGPSRTESSERGEISFQLLLLLEEALEPQWGLAKLCSHLGHGSYCRFLLIHNCIWEKLSPELGIVVAVNLSITY